MNSTRPLFASNLSLTPCGIPFAIRSRSVNDPAQRYRSANAPLAGAGRMSSAGRGVDFLGAPPFSERIGK